MKGSRVRFLFSFCAAILLAAVLLTACGKAASAPAPSAAPQETALPALSPDEAVFSGGDGEVRASLSAAGLSSPRAGQLSVSYRLVNRGTLAVTRLRFSLRCLDPAGQALGEPVSVTCELMEDPLRPGETRSFSRNHYFTGAEKTASVLLTPLSAENELELAPWTEPQPDNLLLGFCNDRQLSARFEAMESEPPVALLYDQDQMRSLRITDPALIREAVEGLRQLRIGQRSDRNVDDGGFTYTLVMADGSSLSFRFDYKTLFYWHGHNYEVLDASALYSLELPEE